MADVRRWVGWLGLGLLVLAEEVCFAGQPSAGHGADVIRYYSHHTAGIVVGNLLWVAAAALLALLVVWRAGAERPPLRSSLQAVSITAAFVMVATSGVAVSLSRNATGMTPADARSAWLLERDLFSMSRWLWLVVVVLAIIALRRERWVAAMMTLLAVSSLLGVGDAAWWLVMTAVAVFLSGSVPDPDTGTGMRGDVRESVERHRELVP